MRIVALLALFSLAVACKDDPPPPPTPHGSSTTTPAQLPDLPSGNITGTLRAADTVAGKVAPGDVAFVMAKNAATGTLLAVSRIQIESLPAQFTLQGGTQMHGASTLAGKVRLEARVDKDGDAMTKNPGDVVGESEALVTVPAKDVVLTLDRML